jgi:hypothetical protein
LAKVQPWQSLTNSSFKRGRRGRETGSIQKGEDVHPERKEEEKS